ncbi:MULTISPECIES: ATP-binding protein [Micromonospora]|uniref:ATP-binding protein n=1 Tax=Micromonospora solifontis TaxID=2487138 RepID=A0ABX9WDJ5_9ACTN|nr:MULTISPECIES: ATP-binding protein [Micromonospora]NES17059.1 ATP-binding protein [Micromonospora sp. PPF5-17B]NES38583.1 ATP-binding protein [Micromonospora solifontis]NES58785.1 ATP-binding protein [Micromonospora sp. PPF5-6]RNL94558.1 ATP-binding protein [Micromonospora solifontis]
MVSGSADYGQAPTPSNIEGVLLLVVVFTAELVPEVRHTLTAAVARAGLSGDEGEDFVLAVHELVTNAVRHGGGSGELRLHRQPGRLTCQVRDHGGGTSADVPALPNANVPGQRGLWLAHHLTGGLTLDTSPHGLTATVSADLCPPDEP